MVATMKKHLRTVALTCAFAVGLVTTSFAQTTSGGEPGAGSVSGAKSDTTGGNPSNSGTTPSPAGASTGMGPASGSTGKASSGVGKASQNTSEDRVPHN
jgi:hypothetical protein